MGCCGVNYEEEIEKDIYDYIQTLNISDETKRKLFSEIKDDLKKRASTDKSYNPSKFTEVEKTVNYYKNYISIKLKGEIGQQELKEKEINLKAKKDVRNNTDNNFAIILNKEETVKKSNKRE